MKRWMDTGSVRFDSVPEGRIWIGRRKPVSIPDAKPWAVAWRERARLRVEFARSHRDAMRFAVSRAFRAEQLAGLARGVERFLSQPDPTVEIAYLKAKLADVEAERDQLKKRASDLLWQVTPDRMGK